MSGRLEQDRKIEEKINSLMTTQPKLIKEYSHSFGNKTYKTKKAYISHVIAFVNYLKREYDIDVDNLSSIKSLNYSHISSYMNYIKTHTPNGSIVTKEAGSCAAEFYAIKHFCKYLMLCRYIEYNPCLDIEVPKDKKQHQIVSLTPEEIKIIQNNINHGVGSQKAKAHQNTWKSRDFCIVMLGITTGLRISALANIDINDINFEEKTLYTIEKGNFERTIFLSDKMIEIMNTWIQDRQKILGDVQCDALFISTHRQRIGHTTIRSLLEKYTYNIQKHITPHKLRSTTATNLYDKTGDIYLVADVLGHHNIQNTRRYAKVSNEKRLLAAQKLSDMI